MKKNRTKDTCVVVHIGDDMVYVTVGYSQEEGIVEVLGVGEADIDRNSSEFGRYKLVSAIKKAINQAEQMANIRVESVWVCVAEPKIKSFNQLASLMIDNERVSSRHMIEVLNYAKKRAKERLELENKEHLEQETYYPSHLVSQVYYLNGERIALPGLIEENQDVNSGNLVSSYHVMLQPDSAYNELIDVFRSFNFAVEGVIFDMLAGAKYALTPTERQDGVLFIHLGERSTSYAVYLENVLIASGCVGVGANHLFETFEMNLDVSKEEGALIQQNYTSLILSPEDQKCFYDIKGKINDTVVNGKKLYDYAKPHYDWVFDEVFTELLKDGLNPASLPKGIVLSGVGSRIKKIDEYLSTRYTAIKRVRLSDVEHHDTIKLHDNVIMGSENRYQFLQSFLNDRSSNMSLGSLLYYFDEAGYQYRVYNNQKEQKEPMTVGLVVKKIKKIFNLNPVKA